MKVLVIGEQPHLDEFRAKFGDEHETVLIGEHRDAEKFIGQNDVIFDFIIDEEPHEFEIYTSKAVTVFVNTCKISLSELASFSESPMKCIVFGFAGMPTFFNRTLLECSLLKNADQSKLDEVARSLKTPTMIVDDRVGMISPRIVCMIINEAYYTVQEGTATREDIDQAMRLGTNYPFGPFDWSKRIGLKHVYEILEALHDDTRDERYKICPLLKQEYLRSF